jgi:hypothetical protein
LGTTGRRSTTTSNCRTNREGAEQGEAARGRDGIARLHAMIGEHLGDDQDKPTVVVGIETERGS